LRELCWQGGHRGQKPEEEARRMTKGNDVPEPMKVAYVFPGQGAQWVGMGRDLYQNFNSAKAVFEQADQALGFPLSRLCFEGPEDELVQTVNAQPAIVTVSFACLEASRNAGAGLPTASFVAGHSLGEYTALAAAGG